MFEVLTPYYDMYLNEPRRRFSRPIKVHRATCHHCDGKLLTLYWSEQLKEYTCRKCMDVFLGERKEQDNV